MTDNQPLSVYLHVPFCQSLCPYCAFYKSLNLKQVDSWIQEMEKDIRELAQSLQRKNQSISTLYFGGGSPGILSISQINTLVAPLKPFFQDDLEWSIELNPQQVSLDYLNGLKRLGANRISLGVQSFHQQRLESLNRCSLKTIIEAIDLIQSFDFALSIDLIYGFADQSLKELEEDLDCFLAKKIDHISLYSLQIEENSVYGKTGRKKCEIDIEQQMDDLIRKKLSEKGFEHYEISSFARNKAYCRHNLRYWSDHYYAGLGPGASGYDPLGYYSHEESLYQYLKGERRLVYEPRDLFTALMMGLRTEWGLDIQRLEKEYKVDLMEVYGSVFEQYQDVLLFDQGRIRLSEKGRDLLDFLLVDLLCCSN